MPEIGLGEDFFAASWDDIAPGFNISAYSLKTVAEATAPSYEEWRIHCGLGF